MWQVADLYRMHVKINTLVGMNYLVILDDTPRVAAETVSPKPMLSD